MSKEETTILESANPFTVAQIITLNPNTDVRSDQKAVPSLLNLEMLEERGGETAVGQEDKEQVGTSQGMTRDEIQKRICEIVFEHLRASENEKEIFLDDIELGSSFMDDLGADSLDVIEIVTTVEEEFDLIIPDELLEQMIKVEDAVNYLASRA